MTFHQKVEEAAAFAEKLPETAAELYVNDASDDDLAAADRLSKSSIAAEFYELEADRHVPPDRVWSAWLCGDHLVSERREVLRQFANSIDAAGRRVHRAFLASVRVLGEGVDITGERGVEAVCFADTRGSQVEIVQNIGRALRLNRDGSTRRRRTTTCRASRRSCARDTSGPASAALAVTKPPWAAARDNDRAFIPTRTPRRPPGEHRNVHPHVSRIPSVLGRTSR